MNENYWIETDLDKKKIVPFAGFYQDKFKLLSEDEFKEKLQTKIRIGIVGMLIGAATIGLGYIAPKYMAKDDDLRLLCKVMYITGALGALAGGKSAFDYFKHRNDKRPNSTDDAFYEYINED